MFLLILFVLECHNSPVSGQCNGQAAAPQNWSPSWSLPLSLGLPAKSCVLTYLLPTPWRRIGTDVIGGNKTKNNNNKLNARNSGRDEYKEGRKEGKNGRKEGRKEEIEGRKEGKFHFSLMLKSCSDWLSPYQ